LVEYLCWSFSSKRLVRPLLVVVAVKLLAEFGDSPLTAHPAGVEAFRAHFEHVKQLFDVVSGVIGPTAQT